MALVTFESVAAAAEALVANGGKASVRAVKDALGGGSPNAILPLLNEWKAGRPLVRASDIALDPRIAQLIAEQIGTASAQAAKMAEDKAAEIQADAEVIAEAGREAEARAGELEQALEQTQAEVVAKSRALEDLGLERERDAESAQEKISTLQIQLQGERERADQAVQTVAKDEVRLQAIPKLEAEVQRLVQFEQQSAVLTARLEDAHDLIEDLKQRLAAAEKAAGDAREAGAKVAREAEQARIGEQSAQAKLESAARELESSRAALTEAKAEVKEARGEAKELRARLLDKPQGEAKPQA
ncbi:DNA-binding protein [Pseudomonas fulva]|uniref:DNA-binding protein n=1 Tax=Pseudomonas fulva TaxID=47880 RepID=UPI002DB7C7D0|nr:DNA-binding protein [Pseudomonas fulva]MEC4025631.1 DNA-binding protein [Pseudomonas fulva]